MYTDDVQTIESRGPRDIRSEQFSCFDMRNATHHGCHNTHISSRPLPIPLITTMMSQTRSLVRMVRTRSVWLSRVGYPLSRSSFLGRRLPYDSSDNNMARASFCCAASSHDDPNIKEKDTLEQMLSETEEGGSLDISDQPATTVTIPGAQKGGRKLAIVFTCTVCETRSAKQFTEQAYTHGVVIVTCPGCSNRHLIADRLGYFDDEDWDLDRIAALRGDDVRVVTNDDVVEITNVAETNLLKDLLGKDKWSELQEVVVETGDTSSKDK